MAGTELFVSQGNFVPVGQDGGSVALLVASGVTEAIEEVAFIAGGELDAFLRVAGDEGAIVIDDVEFTADYIDDNLA